MDISKWPIGDIMALPDNAFGQRFPICVAASAASGGQGFDISEVPFPDRCVLWGFGYWVYMQTYVSGRIRLAYADRVPPNSTFFDRLDPLIMGLGEHMAEPRRIWIGNAGQSQWIPMKKWIEPQGQRLVIELDADENYDMKVQVIVVVSSIPRSVPDWLISVPQSP